MVLAVVAVLLLACSPAAVPPVLLDVEPSWGWSGEHTDIVISGENLVPDVAIDAGTGGAARLEGTFVAWLVRDDAAVPLLGVQGISTSTVIARVPDGLDTGLYDVRVETPSALEAVLTDGFVVTSTRADHLDIEVGDASYDVGQLARLDLALRDPGDAVVAQALEVEVRAESQTGAAGVAFTPAGLDGAEALDGAVGVRGFLQEDGTGSVLVSSSVPDHVTLTVSAVAEADPDSSVVRGDAQLVSWDPGELATIDLALPESPFSTEAGEAWSMDITLRDAQGNVLSETAARILLYEACGSWHDTVEVVGTASVEIVTQKACDANTISAFAEVGETTSAAFTVVASEMAQYLVSAPPGPLRAGQDEAVVVVEAADAFGNRVTSHQAAIDLSDSEDGLDRERSGCDPFVAGRAACRVVLERAGEGVVVTASDAAGHRGDSNPILVVAGTPTTVDVAPGAAEVAAGEALSVTIFVSDAYRNAVAIEPGGADPVVISDGRGPLACTWTGPSGDGQDFACVPTFAEDGIFLEASVASLGVGGAATIAVDVVNGALAVANVVVSPGVVTAGAAFTIDILATDAYGNPYVVQDDPVIDLSDDTGTLSAGSALLGALGDTRIGAAITQSIAATRVRASQDGVELGASGPVQVGPAAAAGFELSVPPWASVQDGVDVSFVAVDAFGNVAVDYAGSVALSAEGGACSSTSIEVPAGGETASVLDCPATAFSESILATDGTLAGESATFDVVDLDCGTAASLLLDGDDDAVVCLSGAVASVTADGTGSDASAILFHVADDDGFASRDATAIATLTYESAGRRTVELLAVEPDGCAGLDLGTVYVGVDDGEPTGPVTVSVADASVDALGATTVTLSADDCTGDVAAGQRLLVRADLGTPAAVSGTEGLEITLDAAGAAILGWDFPTGYASTATFFAGTAAGGGFGSASIEVAQDGVRPTVVEVVPAGQQEGLVDAITVTFDEAMLESASAGVVVTGPAGVVGTTQALVGDTLVITPDDPIDADAGAWTVELQDSFRDAAGNRLDGSWSGSAASFTTSLGAVGSTVPDIATCEADTATLRPDGDGGVGDEADEVVLAPLAAFAPSWWWVVVTDGNGERVRSLRQVGTDASVRWDARGDHGRVVASGTYTLDLRAVDDAGNVGEACTQSIAVEHRLEAR